MRYETEPTEVRTTNRSVDDGGMREAIQNRTRIDIYEW